MFGYISRVQAPLKCTFEKRAFYVEGKPSGGAKPGHGRSNDRVKMSMTWSFAWSWS